MRRCLCLCLASWAATASPSAAGIPTDTFTISLSGGGGHLSAHRGALKVGGAPHDIDSGSGPAPGRWYVEGTRIKSSAGAGYLAYDPSGKDNRVFLAPKPGPGTDWDIDVPNKRRCGEGERGVIRAASGKFKGWVLRLADVKEKRPGGKVVLTERVVLARDAGQRMQVERIYLHK